MSVPAKRQSKSRVRRRRSHHAISSTQISTCGSCNAPALPHRACGTCGFYKGKAVTKPMRKLQAKQTKKQATKTATNAQPNSNAPAAKKIGSESSSKAKNSLQNRQTNK